MKDARYHFFIFFTLFAKTHYYRLHKESHSTPKGQLYDINVNVYQKNTSKANLLMQKSSAPYFTDMTHTTGHLDKTLYL